MTFPPVNAVAVGGATDLQYCRYTLFREEHKHAGRAAGLRIGTGVRSATTGVLARRATDLPIFNVEEILVG